MLATPFRIFYPAEMPGRTRARVYSPRLLHTIMAYVHCLFGVLFPWLRAGNNHAEWASVENHGRPGRGASASWLWWLLWPFLWPMALLIHLLSLATVSPPPRRRKCPTLVFSHGLIGCGDEHSLLFTALAKRGFVVIALTHTDGSAALVRTAALGRATCYYELPPNMHNNSEYPRCYRLRQIEQRADEVQALLDLLSRGAHPSSAAAPMPPLPMAMRRASDDALLRVLTDEVMDWSRLRSAGSLRSCHYCPRLRAEPAPVCAARFCLTAGSTSIWPQSAAASDEQVPFPPLAHERPRR